MTTKLCCGVLMLGCIAFSQAPCPQNVTAAFGNKQQQDVICQLWRDTDALQTALNNSVQVEMVTLKPSKDHHLGKIYAILITGGALVPILPGREGTSISIPVPSQSSILRSCSVVLRTGELTKQDYTASNACSDDVKAIVFYSRSLITPVD